MSTSTMTDRQRDTANRILQEGYGDGAWHGPDLKAALDDVTEATAFTCHAVYHAGQIQLIKRLAAQ